MGPVGAVARMGLPKLGGVIAVLVSRLFLKKRARKRLTGAGFLLRSPLGAGLRSRLVLLAPVSSSIVTYTLLRSLARLTGSPVDRFLQFYEGAFPMALDYLGARARARRLRRRLRSRGEGVGDQAATMKEKLCEMWEERHEQSSLELINLLNELGGFYLKVGQVFATKQDLLPFQYTKRLKLLFDSCKASPGDYIREMLVSELGGDESFASFDYEPIASATIAQVHRATGVQGGEKTRLAVKILHKDVEKLMKSDIGNLIAFTDFVQEKLNLRFNVDQASIMREYRDIVPQEFDFVREVRNLRRIAKRIEGSNVVTPVALSHLCTEKIITMTFLEGPTFSQIIEQQERLHEQSESAEQGLPVGRDIDLSTFRPKELLTSLLEAFGQQIFEEEIFHGDPHPGNLVWVAEDKVGLIDFGECKELRKDQVVLLAKMTIALARGTREMIGEALDNTGVIVEGVASDFKATVAKILFDTRMDFSEAHMSPLDSHAPQEMKLVNVKTVPEDVFMVIRVVTLLRGLMAAFACDVSASSVWEKYARAALDKYGVQVPVPENSTLGAETDNPLHGVGVTPRDVGAIFRDMKIVAQWMKKNGLPHNRQSLTPMAIHGVTSIKVLAALAMTSDPILDAALARFTEEEQRRAKGLAVDQERDAIWREQALIKEQTLLREVAAAEVPKPPKNKKKRSLKSKFAQFFLTKI
ncbi:UbiB-like protein kinase [Chloropicon primus]|uniref:UbiB-like protein kinase n=1 Tax=Chloropicon primus TaxID=1764295 RepID=A0A5B8MPY5_9CHLO|nr:UbiB-like protein kinase [Chloropicon primus]UPR00567.1 UbiB-like protein kinase [Chloropicon primus]|eukprot:QDZ21352.1 UbiB-like protein kinase [Chloropicon primus]